MRLRLGQQDPALLRRNAPPEVPCGERDADRSVSQTVRAQLALRDLILSGSLRPGERISELQAVETTGVSRTPVRMALVRLEEEGLLEAIPSGGFMVKAFSERDIVDSIELRGTLDSRNTTDLLTQLGLDVETSTGEQCTKRLAADMVRWQSILDSLGLKATN